MAKSSSVKFKYDRARLTNIAQFIASSPEVHIGVLSDQWEGRPPREKKNGFWGKWKTEIGPAGLAAVHEFGCKTKLFGHPVTIPQRSFLRLTMTNRATDFAARIYHGKDKIKERFANGEFRQFLGEVGAIWVGYVMDTFDSQGPGWAPLSEYTKSQRREVDGKISEKILWVTGALARSITWKIKGE